MKLFSSLGLNITFLQDFSRSAGSSPLSDLVIDLPLPHLLSISFFSHCVICLHYFCSFLWLSGRDVFCLWVASRPFEAAPSESKCSSCHGWRRANTSSHLTEEKTQPFFYSAFWAIGPISDLRLRLGNWKQASNAKCIGTFHSRWKGNVLHNTGATTEYQPQILFW